MIDDDEPLNKDSKNRPNGEKKGKDDKSFGVGETIEFDL
jgi:hypothetical protein